MTIGMGFKCADGVVLCADTQVTWAGSHKAYESKLFTHWGTDFTVMFTYGGYPEVMKAFFGKFEAAMKLPKVPHTVNGVCQGIETILGLLEPDIVSADPSIGPTHFMLCAIYGSDDSFGLFKTTGRTLRPVDDLDIVGCGDSSLIRYWMKWLPWRDSYSAEHALRIGAFLVHQAIAHVDDCGGDVEARILRPDGTLEDWTGGSIATIEQRIAICEHQAATVMREFLNPDIQEKYFDETWTRVGATLKSYRQHLSSIRRWKSRN